MTAVIGIDPSLAATGIAWPDGGTETVRGSSKQGDQRLVNLRDTIEIGIKSRCGWPTDEILAVIEDLPKQAMGAGLTGRAQGVVREVLTRLSVPYVTVVPSTLKKLYTGSGRADKAEMARAWWAKRENPSPQTLATPDDNQVDAAALRWVGLQRLELGASYAPMIDWSPWPGVA